MITDIKTLPYLQNCSGLLNGKWIINWTEEWKTKRKTPDIKYITYQHMNLSDRGKYAMKRLIRKARRPHWHNPYNIGR